MHSKEQKKTYLKKILKLIIVNQSEIWHAVFHTQKHILYEISGHFEFLFKSYLIIKKLFSNFEGHFEVNYCDFIDFGQI